MQETKRLDEVSSTYSSKIAEENIDLISTCTLEKIKPYLSSGLRTGLMGVGDGFIASALAEQDIELCVVEGSPILAKQFGALHPEAEVSQCLFEEYRPIKPFELIVGTHVLEHVEDPRQIIAAAKSWLAPGGKALFSVPNCDSLHRRLGVIMGILPEVKALSEQDVKLGHRRVYNREEFEADIRAAGFGKVEIEGYILKIAPNKVMHHFDKKLLNAMYELSLGLPVEYCADLFAICQV